MSVQNARSIVYLPINHDPTTFARVVLLHLHVRDVLWRLAVRARHGLGARRIVERDGPRVGIGELGQEG